MQFPATVAHDMVAAAVSPDGKRVIFSAIPSARARGMYLGVIDVDGSNRTPFTVPDPRPGFRVRDPALSPDGRTLLWSGGRKLGSNKLSRGSKPGAAILLFQTDCCHRACLSFCQPLLRPTVRTCFQSDCCQRNCRAWTKSTCTAGRPSSPLVLSSPLWYDADATVSGRI